MYLLSQVIYDGLYPEAVFSTKNDALNYVSDHRFLDRYRYVITKLAHNPDDAQESFDIDSPRTLGAWTFFGEDLEVR